MVKEVKIKLIGKENYQKIYDVLFRKDRRRGFNRIRVSITYISSFEEWCISEAYIYSSIPRFALLKIENILRGLNSNGMV